MCKNQTENFWNSLSFDIRSQKNFCFYAPLEIETLIFACCFVIIKCYIRRWTGSERYLFILFFITVPLKSLESHDSLSITLHIKLQNAPNRHEYIDFWSKINTRSLYCSHFLKMYCNVCIVWNLRFNNWQFCVK